MNLPVLVYLLPRSEAASKAHSTRASRQLSICPPLVPQRAYKAIGTPMRYGRRMPNAISEINDCRSLFLADIQELGRNSLKLVVTEGLPVGELGDQAPILLPTHSETSYATNTTTSSNHGFGISSKMICRRSYRQARPRFKNCGRARSENRLRARFRRREVARKQALKASGFRTIIECRCIRRVHLGKPETVVSVRRNRYPGRLRRPSRLFYDCQQTIEKLVAPLAPKEE